MPILAIQVPILALFIQSRATIFNAANRTFSPRWPIVKLHGAHPHLYSLRFNPASKKYISFFFGHGAFVKSRENDLATSRWEESSSVIVIGRLQMRRVAARRNRTSGVLFRQQIRAHKQYTQLLSIETGARMGFDNMGVVEDSLRHEQREVNLYRSKALDRKEKALHTSRDTKSYTNGVFINSYLDFATCMLTLKRHATYFQAKGDLNTFVKLKRYCKKFPNSFRRKRKHGLPVVGNARVGWKIYI